MTRYLSGTNFKNNSFTQISKLLCFRNKLQLYLCQPFNLLYLNPCKYLALSKGRWMVFMTVWPNLFHKLSWCMGYQGELWHLESWRSTGYCKRDSGQLTINDPVEEGG